jgi:2-polyprenyl-6-hydroxyphenyl methylase/3-demethylubiquinone-9 3-methyltransferase
VRPSELAAGLRAHGMVVRALNGISYEPLADRWSISPDLAVNYLLFATQPKEK